MLLLCQHFALCFPGYFSEQNRHIPIYQCDIIAFIFMSWRKLNSLNYKCGQNRSLNLFFHVGNLKLLGRGNGLSTRTVHIGAINYFHYWTFYRWKLLEFFEKPMKRWCFMGCNPWNMKSWTIHVPITNEIHMNIQWNLFTWAIKIPW